MRVKTYSRMLRITAAVTLCFFSWTFLPIYSVVAYASEKKQETKNQWAGSRGKGQMAQGTGSGVQGPVTSGERFEKVLGDIREKVSKADEKQGRGEDVKSEIEAIRKHKAEIEAIDVELKKEFAATREETHGREAAEGDTCQA